MINNSSWGKRRSMEKYMPKAIDSLLKIFDNTVSIQDQDRISLITYTQQSRRIFSLVEKCSNFTQLRNQVEQLSIDVAHHNERP
jgi:hypothetical protein